MLKLRVATALVLAGMLLVALFLFPPVLTVVLFGLVNVLGGWEWARFGGLQSVGARGAYAILIAALLWFGWIFGRDPARLQDLMRAACIWWVVAFLWLSLAPTRHRPALTLLCGIPVLVPSFVALASLQVGRGTVDGPEAVLWLLLLVFGADIGAFFAGRKFGRLQLAPRVSPGKTWEGAVGGMVVVAAIAWAGAVRFRVPAAAAVGFGCAVGLFSIVGDLTESMFKRAAGLKDSGALLPGHGGIFDRIDSICAAAPLYALGLIGMGHFA